MGQDVFIEVQGLQAVQRALAGITSVEVLSPTIKETGSFIRGKLQRYPTPRYVGRAEAYGQTFKSDAMRIWFFGALKRGEIKVPYSRTNRLSQGWKLVHYGGADWAVENAIPYVGLVQGEEQSRMMEMKGWRTYKRVMFEEAQGIERTARETYNREFNRYVGRVS